ncbi:hypothetical protein J6590_020512 [Homalodisca vitripennis]|nr:hypothetical protein J6590_020512 [Homalodisca vitripennis]
MSMSQGGGESGMENCAWCVVVVLSDRITVNISIANNSVSSDRPWATFERPGEERRESEIANRYNKSRVNDLKQWRVLRMT